MLKVDLRMTGFDIGHKNIVESMNKERCDCNAIYIDCYCDCFSRIEVIFTLITLQPVRVKIDVLYVNFINVLCMCTL